MQTAIKKHAVGPHDFVEAPLIVATPESLKGLGMMVDDRDEAEIEIVTWPVSGRRPLDPDTGNQGGTTEGVFEFWWEGPVLQGWNRAVDGRYTLALDDRYPDSWPQDGATPQPSPADGDRQGALLRHANYHPDGGQLFFPLDAKPFVVPLAKPGEELRLEDFAAYYFDGSCGLCIHPGVWHETILPIEARARFFDRQGRVHARISSNFDEEFDAHLKVPLKSPMPTTD